MNQFDAFSQRRRGGWWAMLRLARDGEAKPLLDKGGVPVVFPDELSATKAALLHVLQYFNGHLVSSGEIAGGSLKAARFERAELLFRKGKKIEVQRVGKGSEARP